MTKHFWNRINILWSYIASQVIFKAYGFATALPAQFDSDSGSYRGGNGISNWGWVSLSGAHYGRGWPIVALYSVFKGDNARIFLQSFISLAAWIIFGLAFTAHMRSRKWKSISLATIFLFSNISQTQNWNNWIGRESITLSLVLLSFSLGIYLRSSLNFIFYYANIAIIAIYVITKPSTFVIALVQWLLLLLMALRHSSSRKKLSLRISFLAICMFYVLINIFNQNIGWSKADPTGRSETMIAYSYVISDFNPEASYISLYFAGHGAPPCSVKKEPTTFSNPGEPMEYAATLHDTCPGFDSWIAHNFSETYTRYLFTHPLNSLKIVEKQLAAALFIYPAGKSFSVFGSTFNHKLFTVTIFDWWIILAITMSLFEFFSRERESRRTSLRRIGVFCSYMFICFLSIVFSLLSQPTHATDISRQNFVANIILRLLIVLLPIHLLESRRLEDGFQSNLPKSNSTGRGIGTSIL